MLFRALTTGILARAQNSGSSSQHDHWRLRSNRAVDTRISRRSFLASASATLAVASSARLRAARVPASDRVIVGVVGWGMQGPNNTKAFLKLPNCQVVAACDIDKNRLQDGA